MKLISLLFLCIAFTSFAQKYSFVKYSNNEGLPQSQVTAITQSNDGYLWIGTLGGLAKFNGSKFITYDIDNGLLSNRISSLKFIGNELFIGMEGGISILHNEKFKHALLPKEQKVVQVKEVIEFNNKIFVATNGGGIYTYANDSLIPIELSYTIENKEFTLKKVRDLLVYKQQLLIATNLGIFSLDKKQKLSVITSPKKNSFSGLESNGTNVFATSYNGLLIKYNTNLSNYTTVHASKKYRYRQLHIAGNQVWLNAKNGVEQRNLSSNKSIQFSFANGLETQDINVVFKDREGNVWFGSSGKGLLKLAGEAFTYYTKQDNLTSDLILSILETNKGEFYFSSYDNGITKKTVDGLFKPFPTPGTSVWCSLETKDGRIFFGTSNGLFEWEKEKWKSYKNEAHNLPGIKISALYETNDGSIYIGSTDGFSILKDNILTKDTELLSPNLEVKAFLETDKGIYIITQKAIYIRTNEKSKLISLDKDYNFSSIVESENNQLWVGAEQGFFKLKDDTLQQISLGENSRSNAINFLNVKNNNIYIGTNNGLFKYDTKNYTKVHYGINEGLRDLETNINSSFFDSENNFWFGTSNGLMCLDLNKEYELIKNVNPKINFANLKLSKTTEPIASFCDGFEENGFPINLEIPYKYNGLSITLDGLYLSNPDAIRYKTSLNEDLETVATISEESTINFASLGYGEYEFVAIALTIDGLSSEEITLSFSILPPFYATTWFIVTSLFLLSLLAFLAFKINSKRIKNIQERKLYEEKLKFQGKLSKLEQQSLNASMNRHFIFNSLNSIQYYINANDKLSANKFLTRFAKLIRQNLDSSNTKNGLISLKEEIERLSLYMDLERMRFSEKFQYHINIAPTVDIDAVEVPGMLLQPFVENSIIHGVLPKPNPDGEIIINIKDENMFFILEVIDNGVGIDNSISKKSTIEGDHNSHGMEITSKRIDIMEQLSERKMILEGPMQINKTNGIINGTLVRIKIAKNSFD